MRLIVLGRDHHELPTMPTDVTSIWIAFPAPKSMLDWVLNSSVPVTVVAKNPAKLGDDLLDQVADVIKTDDPREYLIDASTPEDVVLMSWDDSDECHKQLQILTNKGVTVQDMLDDFQQLVIQNPLEELLKAISESITRDVLKTVRAEIREQLAARPRRARSAKE